MGLGPTANGSGLEFAPLVAAVPFIVMVAVGSAVTGSASIELVPVLTDAV